MEETDLNISRKTTGLRTVPSNYIRKTDIINAIIIFQHLKESTSPEPSSWYAAEFEAAKTPNEFAAMVLSKGDIKKMYETYFDNFK